MTNEAASPLEEAVTRVGDRWSLLVVDALLGGPRRFNDLHAAIDGLAPNILSRRLKQLEQAGVVVARAYSRRPLRMTYELTAAGRELGSALRLLAAWGAGQAEDAEPVRHATCGTPAEARWFCPTCARPVDDAEATDLIHL
jgi:DNA-binding HxlR family transcriptional regulator